MFSVITFEICPKVCDFLLKKSKNPMSYYYKELEKYLKRNSNSVNTIIGGGKTADLIEDSTHEK